MGRSSVRGRSRSSRSARRCLAGRASVARGGRPSEDAGRPVPVRGGRPSEVRGGRPSEDAGRPVPARGGRPSDEAGRPAPERGRGFPPRPSSERRSPTMSLLMRPLAAMFAIQFDTAIFDTARNADSRPEGRLSRKNVRQRPTLPHPRECSTIGAERLSFRVRNGTGRFPFAMAAETLWRYTFGFPTVSREPHSGRVERLIKSSHRPISTGQLRGSLVPSSTSGLSTRWSAGGLSGRIPWKPHLETSFPLRCFQRLSLPNVANQPCSWRNNWHTRGSSTPVLSY